MEPEANERLASRTREKGGPASAERGEVHVRGSRRASGERHDVLDTATRVAAAEILLQL